LAYDVFLELYKDHYLGKVSVDIGDEVGRVRLDAVGMDVLSVRRDGKEQAFSYDGKHLEVGGNGGSLEVSFKRHIGNSLMGLYRADYIEDGKEHYVLSTQLEPNGARMVFPCFDVPNRKARFRLKLRVPAGLEAISNMPAVDVREEGSTKLVTFAETPPMSTYLLYVGAGDFTYLKGRYRDVDLSVVAYGGRAERGAFALDVAARALEVYEEYFGVPYMLPKLDLIAVPEFAMGAMENWGAITFREQSLLLEEGSGEAARRRVASTLVHELAHQWFGDLVTMNWWDDLWLNESFATFLSYKVLDRLFPSWDMWSDFLSSETSESLAEDSLRSTHPIHVNVVDEDEIEQIFDSISYGKGASVLRMIEAYVGEDAFKRGLNVYLKEHSYSNASASDLWNSLEATSKKPVSKIMSAWVERPGHPVLEIRSEGSGIALSQRRFSYLGDLAATWPVPVSYCSSGGSAELLLEEPSRELPVSRPLKLNCDGVGYYRVSYENWDEAFGSCKTRNDVWNVLVDAYARLLAGGLEASQYLSLLSKLRLKKDQLIFLEASGQIASLYPLSHSAFSSEMKEFHSAQLSIWSSEKGENASFLAALAARRLALVDADFGRSLVERPFGTLDGDMRYAAALSLALYSDDPFERLREMYARSGADDRVKLLYGMTQIRSREALERALQFFKSSDVRRQDLVQIASASTNPNGDLVWNWFTDNFQWLREVFQGSGILPRLISRMVPYIGLGREDQVKRFFQEIQAPEASMGIRSGLEMLEVYSRLKLSLAAAGSRL